MIYYYEKAGKILAAPFEMAGLTPASAPAEGPLFYAVHGDAKLGRGSFKVTHPGQLADRQRRYVQRRIQHLPEKPALIQPYSSNFA